MSAAELRRAGILLGGLAILALAALAGWALVRPAPELVQGQVEATHVDVSPKIPGRVQELLVREGQRVQKGDAVAVLDSPELQARLEQAEAARRGARAQSDKAQRGARSEEIRQAHAMWSRAREGSALAHKTFERLERLHRDGVVPAQRRDEAETQWKAAAQAEEAAKAALDMAEAGARDEDKDTAAAAVDRARGAVAEVEAFLKEARLTTPIAGEVVKRNVEPGELVSPGFPVVSVVDLSDVWVTLELREDRLAGLKPGDTFTARIPALGDRAVPLEVFYVAAQADFATWRATSANGGFDLKTFEVRARPVAPVAGLRPGMSALVRWDRK